MTPSIPKILIALLLTLLSGCGVPKKSSTNQEVIDGPFKPIVDTIVDQRQPAGELKMSAEASVALVETLSRILGQSGELTWNSSAEHKIDIGNSGTITLQPGTKVRYEASESGTLFTFGSPRPSIKAPAGPIKVKVALVSVDFHSDNSGVAVLDTGVLGIKKSHRFKIDFDDQGEPDKPIKSEAATPQRQVVWCYTTSNCGPCEQAKAAIRAAGNYLPFDVKFTTDAPSWVDSFPTFHWTDSSGKSWKQVGWPGIEQLRGKVLGETALRSTPKTTWTYAGGDTKPALIRHLLNDGIHRGKFSKNRLEQLTRDQLVMLHSKDHNENQ